ncbi:MAG: NAD(P)H-dependent oxidoreductase [Oscillospiraceae bacterium]|nr:NAD(P)H-dependent oxidoreductase [Oscillospiraceae bacterium]
MNITVINGTEQKGCTFAMKEIFLSAMGGSHNITEHFLPRDCPQFCAGCKTCFFQGISVCSHSNYIIPIWESILSADLIVFASPTYVFHATGQVKALLDHFGSKWMVHSPEKPMFRKQVVIITNAIGQGMGKTARDIKDSLDFWGIARTYIIKKALFQPKWELVSDKTKVAVKSRCEKVAKSVKSKTNVKPRFKIRFLFFIMKTAQKMIDKSERKSGRERTKDYLHWKENGWLDGKKPWRD